MFNLIVLYCVVQACKWEKVYLYYIYRSTYIPIYPVIRSVWTDPVFTKCRIGIFIKIEIFAPKDYKYERLQSLNIIKLINKKKSKWRQGLY